MSDRIRVAVIDDHPLIREGVAYALQAHSDMEVIGQGASAQDAERIARDLTPDVMLLDISMPGGGVNAVAAVGVARPEVRMIMLTVSRDESDVMQAIKSGARGYVLKGVAASELVEIIRVVHAGELYITPTLATRLLLEVSGAVQKPAQPGDLLSTLSERESQVLQLVGDGLSNKEIGRQLHLTEKTVKHYMSSILTKLQVRNRTEAAVLSREHARGEPEA